MSAPALMVAQPISLKSKELRSKSPPAVGHPSKAPTLLWCCAHIIFLEYLENTSGSRGLRPPPGELKVDRPAGAKLMSSNIKIMQVPEEMSESVCPQRLWKEEPECLSAAILADPEITWDQNYWAELPEKCVSSCFESLTSCLNSYRQKLQWTKNLIVLRF